MGWSSTLLVEQLVQTSPQITCYSGSTTNNAAALASASALPQEEEAREASHDLLDYYLNDSISDAPSASDAAFDQLDIKLDTLDFSLTRRLLGAVFFLLIIYAWKQYIDDEEESDTIYI
uniref:Uncharacterized protein n=1 Tax=Anopheles dirus TaxID=7168 RepID=A0A182NQZ4_9DIPT